MQNKIFVEMMDCRYGHIKNGIYIEHFCYDNAFRTEGENIIYHFINVDDYFHQYDFNNLNVSLQNKLFKLAIKRFAETEN